MLNPSSSRNTVDGKSSPRASQIIFWLKNMSFRQAYVLAWGTCLLLFVLDLSIDAFLFFKYKEFHPSYSNNVFSLSIFLIPLLLLIKSSSEAFKRIKNGITRFWLRMIFVVINVMIARLIIGIVGTIYICEMGIDCL